MRVCASFFIADNANTFADVFNLLLIIMRYDIYLKGYVGGWDFDPDFVDWTVERLDGKPINVLIDSTGGSAAAGFAVQHAFRRHGNVSVHMKGYCASAATIAAMGAAHVTIDSTAFFLVHKASMPLEAFDRNFNADEFAELLKDLKKAKAHLDDLDALIAQQYARRCKKKPEELLALMAEERCITPAEALEWGFVDAVVETDDTADLSPMEVQAIADGILPELPNAETVTQSVAEVSAPGVEAVEPAPSQEDEPGYVARLFARINALFERLRPGAVNDATQDAPADPPADPAPAAPVSEDKVPDPDPDDPPTRPVISTGTGNTASPSDFAQSIARARALYNSLP